MSLHLATRVFGSLSNRVFESFLTEYRRRYYCNELVPHWNFWDCSSSPSTWHQRCCSIGTFATTMSTNAYVSHPGKPLTKVLARLLGLDWDPLSVGRYHPSRKKFVVSPDPGTPHFSVALTGGLSSLVSVHVFRVAFRQDQARFTVCVLVVVWYHTVQVRNHSHTTN